jgi:conjugative transfer signal peptidase TraF
MDTIVNRDRPSQRHVPVPGRASISRSVPHGFLYLYLGIGLLLLDLAPTLGGFAPPLLLQMTPSEPTGVYWLSPLPPTLTRGMLITLPVPPQVQDLVFSHDWLPRSWHGAEVRLVKPVAALEGDLVCVDDAAVFVNGHAQGPVYRQLGGVDLPVIRGCWTLQADEVFLLSTAIPNSLDGRYFGLLTRTDLHRTAVPLLTW